MALSSSLQTPSHAQTTDTLLAADLRNTVQKRDTEVESDSNFRILERKEVNHRRYSSATEILQIVNARSLTLGLQLTSDPSTGRSVPTNSSHGSRNRATIAPETVAHLLSDQVAGMTFDDGNQIWVKSRNSSNTENTSHKGSAGSDVTDDDLLGAIPDLSVDEIEELRKLTASEYAAKMVASASASDCVSKHNSAASEGHTRPPADKIPMADSRPQTADGKQTGMDEVSSAPSKYSHLASSGPTAETRATSWGDEAFGRQQCGLDAADRHS